MGLLAAALALVALGCSPSGTGKGDLESQGGAGGGGSELGSDLKSADGWFVFGEVAAAARGDEGAVVYLEGLEEGDAGRARVLLQRFDASGTFFGDALQMASGPLLGLESVSIASSGETYLVCWAGSGEVSCSAVGEALEPEPVFHEQGRAVAVVHGSHTWLIAYATDPLVELARFVLRRFGDDFEPQSSDLSFRVASEISSYFPIPLLASTDTGFLLVADEPAQGNRAQLYRLDPELNRLGDAIDLGHAFWFSGCIAANENLVAVSLAVPYGSNLMLIDAGGVVQSAAIPGGNKTGMHQALLAQESKVVASWFTTEPRLYTQAFSNGTETPVLPPGTTADVALGAVTSTSSKLVLVRVSNQVLAVYPTSPGGPALGDNWRAAGIAARHLSVD